MAEYHEAGLFAPEAEPDANLEQFLTKYWLEVFYQSIKLDLQSTAGWGLEIRLKPANEAAKMKWSLAAWPDGECRETWNRGMPAADAATKGKEARTLYKMLRGFLPISVAVDAAPPKPVRKKAAKGKGINRLFNA
jgi:hypothetical protein